MELLDSIVQIVGTFRVSESTAAKVLAAVEGGASAWAVAGIIAGATGPLAIGAGVVYYMIKKKLKGLGSAAAIAW